MDNGFIKKTMAQTLATLKEDMEIASFLNAKLKCPEPFCGTEAIRLIILGQDPTVKDEVSREKITTVLNLDKPGSLSNYISQIAEELGAILKENVYATNMVKNFFIKPPTQFDDSTILPKCALAWRSLLLQELEMFPDTPIIALGEPVLNLLVTSNKPKRMREYWGYINSDVPGNFAEFRYLKPDENILKRIVFPFPHQPSISKRFYKETLSSYLEFVKKHFNQLTRLQ